MHTKTCASAVKIYLFLLFISLFAVSGCGLDIDFGSGTDTSDAEKNEVVTGFIEEVIPDTDTGDSSLVVKASVVKDETVLCCEDTTSVRDHFRIEGDLDPKAELEFFAGDSSLGTIRISVFPGAVIDIPDISIVDRVPSYSYINIGFEGQVDSKNCLNDTSPGGTMRVKISSEDKETEVIVNMTSGTTDIQRGDEEDLPCEEIVEGRKVKVDGKLKAGETVEAGLIEIL